MNRKIKFRAWSKEYKRWATHEELLGVIPVSATVLSPSTITVCAKNDDDEDEWIPLQFTGLLDKNGKEIYEGDILASKYDKRPFEIIWKDGIGDLQQEVGFWMLNKFTNSVFMIHQGHINDRKLEIIGNIYESPELLNN